MSTFFSTPLWYSAWLDASLPWGRRVWQSFKIFPPPPPMLTSCPLRKLVQLSFCLRRVCFETVPTWVQECTLAQNL